MSGWGIKLGEKDGGKESHVRMWGIEIKRWFSIIFLRFDDGTRDAYHNHAFNCFSWLMSGRLVEYHKDGGWNVWDASFRPFITRKETYHKVRSVGVSWVITFRGPWDDTWKESIDGEERTLTHGRCPIEKGDS